MSDKPSRGALVARFPLLVSACLVAGVCLKVFTPELHAAICGPLPTVVL